MAESVILVNFVSENNFNVEVDVEPDTVVGDILEQLVDNHYVEPLKDKMHWVVAFKETGRVLDLDKTLAENGVTDGTALRVVQHGEA